MTDNASKATNEKQSPDPIDLESFNNAADSNNNDQGEKVNVEPDNTAQFVLEIQKLKARCAELEDQALRQRAEHENARKATYKDADKRVGIAIKKVVTKFLTVMGAFSQGIQSAEKAKDITGVLSGMKMVESMFTSALVELDVQEINAAPGTPLDPALHQAISKVESTEFAPNSIVSVISKGYTYQGLLLQPAMVIVSAQPSAVKN